MAYTPAHEPNDGAHTAPDSCRRSRTVVNLCLLQVHRRPGMPSCKYQNKRQFPTLLTSSPSSPRTRRKGNQPQPTVNSRYIWRLFDVSGTARSLQRIPRCYLMTAASILLNSWSLDVLNFSFGSEAHRRMKMILVEFCNVSGCLQTSPGLSHTPQTCSHQQIIPSVYIYTHIYINASLFP